MTKERNNDRERESNVKILQVKNGLENKKSELKNGVENLKRSSIGFCKYVTALFYILTNKKIKPSNSPPNNFDKIKHKIQIADKIRDFDYILNKLNEFEHLERMLLNNYQILALNYIKKSDRVSTELLSHSDYYLLVNEEEKLQLICDYFINLLNDNPLTGNDEYIFTRLENNIQERILTNLTKK